MQLILLGKHTKNPPKTAPENPSQTQSNFSFLVPLIMKQFCWFKKAKEKEGEERENEKRKFWLRPFFIAHQPSAKCR